MGARRATRCGSASGTQTFHSAIPSAQAWDHPPRQVTSDAPRRAFEERHARCRRSPLGREGLAILALRKCLASPAVALSVSSQHLWERLETAH